MTNNQVPHNGGKNGLANESKSGRRDSASFDAMKEDLEEMGNAATHEARKLAGAARHQAQRFAESQKNHAAHTIDDVANVLRDLGTKLQDKANLRNTVERAAMALEDVSDSFRNKTFGDLYEEAEDFARRRPLTTALGTAAVGLFIARFIKSSAERSGYARGYGHARDAYELDRARRYG